MIYIYIFCFSFQVQSDLHLLQQGISGEIMLTQSLKNAIDSLCVDTIPKTWLKETKIPCNSVIDWLQTLPDRVTAILNYYYEKPSVLWIPSFLRPDRLFPAVLQTHAMQNFCDGTDLSLTFEVIPFYFLLNNFTK